MSIRLRFIHTMDELATRENQKRSQKGTIFKGALLDNDEMYPTIAVTMKWKPVKVVATETNRQRTEG